MFMFELGDEVQIIANFVPGKVISRCESLVSANVYLVRHLNGDNDLVHGWYDEDAIEIVEEGYDDEGNFEDDEEDDEYQEIDAYGNKIESD